MRDRIIQTDQEIKNLEKEREKLLEKLRADCDHATVIETDFVPAGLLLRPQPPAKRCLICGKVEESWSKYMSLKAEPIRKVTRDEFRSAWKLKPLKTQTKLVPEDF